MTNVVAVIKISQEENVCDSCHRQWANLKIIYKELVEINMEKTNNHGQNMNT